MKHVIAISIGLMLALVPLSCKKADDPEQLKLDVGTPLAVGPMRSMDVSEAEFIKRNAEKIIAGESVIPSVDEEVAAAAPVAGPGGVPAAPGDMGGPGGSPAGVTPGGMPGAAAAPGGMAGMPGAPTAPTAPPAPAPRPGGGPADANDAAPGALW